MHSLTPKTSPSHITSFLFHALYVSFFDVLIVNYKQDRDRQQQQKKTNHNNISVSYTNLDIFVIMILIIVRWLLSTRKPESINQLDEQNKRESERTSKL